MANSKLEESTVRYAQQFKHWRSTADTFFDIAEKEINSALASGKDNTTIVADIADAWEKCMTAQWTLFKSGKQTARRMALRRGVDNRQFHPAQLKKKGAVASKVDDVLDN